MYAVAAAGLSCCAVACNRRVGILEFWEEEGLLRARGDREGSVLAEPAPAEKRWVRTRRILTVKLAFKLQSNDE